MGILAVPPGPPHDPEPVCRDEACEHSALPLDLTPRQAARPEGQAQTGQAARPARAVLDPTQRAASRERPPIEAVRLVPRLELLAAVLRWQQPQVAAGIAGALMRRRCGSSRHVQVAALAVAQQLVAQLNSENVGVICTITTYATPIGLIIARGRPLRRPFSFRGGVLRRRNGGVARRAQRNNRGRRRSG
jgi:hypothetical protein